MYDEQKPHEHEIAPDLAAFEQQLRGIAPTAPRIDRDRLMFAAGHAAAALAEAGRDGRAMYDRVGHPLYIAGPSWAAPSFWPAATATMTAASLLLAAMLVRQNWSKPNVELATNPSRMNVVENPRVATEIHEDLTASFVRRDRWSTMPLTSSGYLGVRYIAVTRGVASFPPELETEDFDRNSRPNDQRAPATARGLRDELLPTFDRMIPSNS